MKRSEINSHIRWAEKFLAESNIRLPELAYWTPDELKARRDSLVTVRRLELGWDITDFGSGEGGSIRTRLGWPGVELTDRTENVGAATMPPPAANFSEQVIYHDLPAGADGFCEMRIVNAAFGADVSLRFRKSELPNLVQWRQAGFGDYVMGLEPANCYPEGQVEIAHRGLLRRIEPGQVVETKLAVEVL